MAQPTLLRAEINPPATLLTMTWSEPVTTDGFAVSLFADDVTYLVGDNSLTGNGTTQFVADISPSGDIRFDATVTFHAEGGSVISVSTETSNQEIIDGPVVNGSRIGAPSLPAVWPFPSRKVIGRVGGKLAGKWRSA